MLPRYVAADVVATATFAVLSCNAPNAISRANPQLVRLKVSMVEALILNRRAVCLWGMNHVTPFYQLSTFFDLREKRHNFPRRARFCRDHLKGVLA
jgi:hypothetical protein